VHNIAADEVDRDFDVLLADGANDNLSVLGRDSEDAVRALRCNRRVRSSK